MRLFGGISGCTSLLRLRLRLRAGARAAARVPGWPRRHRIGPCEGQFTNASAFDRDDLEGVVYHRFD